MTAKMPVGKITALDVNDALVLPQLSECKKASVAHLQMMVDEK